MTHKLTPFRVALIALMIVVFVAAWYLAVSFASVFVLPAHGQELATESTESHRASAQLFSLQSIFQPARTITVEVYNHQGDDSEIVQLLPKEFKIEKGARFKLQWALDTERAGRLTYFEVENPNSCPAKVRIIWQSKRMDLRAAVKSFLGRGR